MSTHLTNEQFHELLFAPESLDAGQTRLLADRDHLNRCEACREEFSSLSHSLGSFRRAATQFSAAKAPNRLLAPSARAGLFTLPRLVWAGGVAAALALGAASFNAAHHPVAPTAAAVQTQANVLEARSSGPEAQSDDALLKGIDQDLSTAVPPSLQPLSVTASAEPAASTSN